MTQTTRFIAGDWGTSNLTLYLCEHNHHESSTSNHAVGIEEKPRHGSVILDTRSGPGINRINGDFETTFFNLVQDWLDQCGDIPVLLSGMVGSTIGWKEAPYLPCPASAAQITSKRLKFEARGIRFSILTGLRTHNPLGEPDVMRGEELQVLGWLRQQTKLTGKRMIVLPGTHNKWALVENNKISSFLTAFTGELFALLVNHSVLISKEKSVEFNQSAYFDGLEMINKQGNAQLVHTLFSARSKQVLGEMSSAEAANYVSGMIIGADVLGASKLFGDIDEVNIIAEPELSRNYAIALEYFGLASETCDPSEVAISGYNAIFEQLIALGQL